MPTPKPLEERDYSSLICVTLSCTDCGTERHDPRATGITELWERIDGEQRLPATHRAVCSNCDKAMPHFVDWPSLERRPSK